MINTSIKFNAGSPVSILCIIWLVDDDNNNNNNNNNNNTNNENFDYALKYNCRPRLVR